VRQTVIQRILPWVLPLGLLVSWQLFSQFGVISTKVLPAPLTVVASAIRLTQSGELPLHLLESFKRAMAGLVIGGLLGFGFGLFNGVSPWTNSLFDSSIQMIRNIPHLAMIPLVILWFGIGESAKLFLIVIGVFFPIYINTLHGIRSIDERLVQMGKVYRLSRFELFTKVILPGALPSILVGLRYALGIMWLTLIVAETIASDNGIGFMTMNARDFLQTDIVLLGILLYAALGANHDARSVFFAVVLGNRQIIAAAGVAPEPVE
jgi:sulfonate transport system permease protein